MVDLEVDLRMDLPDDDDEILLSPYTEAEDTATKRPTEPEDNEDPVYVITKGKEEEDTGIYTNWGEVAPKVTGVPGNSHVRCVNLAEAKYHLERAGFSQPQIDHFVYKAQDINNNTTTRKLRERKKHDYRALHGGNSKQQPTTINASPNNPPDEDKIKGEITRMKRVIENMKKKAEKDEQCIKDLEEENTTLRHQLKRIGEEKELALQKVKKMEDAAKATSRNKEEHPHTKTRVNLIADSNRKHIIEPLRRMLSMCTVWKPDQLYTTSHLVEAIRRKTLPTSQIDVILMGTNDVRHGTTDAAVDNYNRVKASVDANKTVVAHIPPIEIGNPDDDEYEEKVTDRTILNRHISTTFPDNHIKIPSIQKSHHHKSISTSDGFHLTKEGGEMMANAITARIKKMIAPVPPPNV